MRSIPWIEMHLCFGFPEIEVEIFFFKEINSHLKPDLIFFFAIDLIYWYLFCWIPIANDIKCHLHSASLKHIDKNWVENKKHRRNRNSFNAKNIDGSYSNGIIQLKRILFVLTTCWVAIWNMKRRIIWQAKGQQ